MCVVSFVPIRSWLWWLLSLSFEFGALVDFLGYFLDTNEKSVLGFFWGRDMEWAAVSLSSELVNNGG